jgi:hypothetical protein
MVCIFDPACELLPPWTKELYGRYLCTVAPLLYLLSDLLPPLPLPKVQFIQTVYDVGGGVGVLKCTVDHILQEFYTLFLTRFRTYKIALPPQTKLTSKDDIKELVSLSSFVHAFTPPPPPHKLFWCYGSIISPFSESSSRYALRCCVGNFEVKFFMCRRTTNSSVMGGQCRFGAPE